MPIVTLSREYGAGGLVVGRRVADLLGVDLLDSAIIAEVARRLRVSEDAVQRWDERGEGIILRLLRSMHASHPEYAPLPLVPDDVLANPPDSETIARGTTEVIREAARAGRAVIVGRGGAITLADWPGATHVRLVASKESRIRRIASAAGIDEAAAAKEVDAADRERTAYLKHHFGDDCSDPHLYALVINTGLVGVERAAELIHDLVRGRSGDSAR